MDFATFVRALPQRYYAWGSIAPQPLTLASHAAVLQVVRGMTAPAAMELLSFAVAHLEDGECYLEVGTWHGATLIAALAANRGAQGYAIDDASMTGHDAAGVDPAAQWQINIGALGLASRARYISGHVPECYAGLSLPPVGVFFYDGGKSTEDEAYAGIVGALPLLAPRALIILDDANTPQIRGAAWRLTRSHPQHCAIILDFPTPANAYPTFWNGMLGLAWDGGAR